MKKKILIVDDNQNNLLTLDILLEDFENTEIFTATNGKEAIEICQQNQIHIIFMDIMMPIMDGIEATKRIRNFDKKALIVAVTALDDEDSKNIMIKYGAEDYIIKPIDSIIFKKRFEKYLELVDYRYQSNYDNEAINLFNKNVFNRSLSFRIFDNISLSEFWEYFLTDNSKQVNNLTDCIRVIYVLGQISIKNNQKFNVVQEESQTHLYITQTNLTSIDDKSIKRIVLKNYPELTFAIHNNTLSFVFLKQQNTTVMNSPSNQIELSEEEQKVLRISHENTITSEEFLNTTPINLIDKIEELEHIEDKIDLSIMNFEKDTRQDNLAQIVGYLSIYNNVINELIEFQNLSIGINSLIKFLEPLNEEKISKLNARLFTSLMLSVLEDLSNWRDTIFIKQDAKDIHYLDSSLLNSCLQIENILEDKEIDNDNDLELF